MDIRLPRIAPGGELQPEHINAPNAALERLQLRIGPGAGLGYSSGPGGMTIWATERQTWLWGKITGHVSGVAGSSGPYAWTEQETTPDGTWVNGSREGTTGENSAYESTGNTAVPLDGSVIVRMTWGESGQVWAFTYAACS